LVSYLSVVWTVCLTHNYYVGSQEPEPGCGWSLRTRSDVPWKQRDSENSREVDVGRVASDTNVAMKLKGLAANEADYG
jgi:hypothetical protein